MIDPIYSQYPIDVSAQSILDFLPDEIVLKIFSYLSGIDLIQSSKISRRYRTLTEDDFLWRLVFEVQAEHWMPTIHYTPAYLKNDAKNVILRDFTQHPFGEEPKGFLAFETNAFIRWLPQKDYFLFVNNYFVNVEPNGNVMLRNRFNGKAIWQFYVGPYLYTPFFSGSKLLFCSPLTITIADIEKRVLTFIPYKGPFFWNKVVINPLFENKIFSIVTFMDESFCPCKGLKIIERDSENEIFIKDAHDLLIMDQTLFIAIQNKILALEPIYGKEKHNLKLENWKSVNQLYAIDQTLFAEGVTHLGERQIAIAKTMLTQNTHFFSISHSAYIRVIKKYLFIKDTPYLKIINLKGEVKTLLFACEARAFDYCGAYLAIGFVDETIQLFDFPDLKLTSIFAGVAGMENLKIIGNSIYVQGGPTSLSVKVFRF
jgi:hypothetical protein